LKKLRTTLIIFLLLVIITFIIGDFVLNRYLNNNGKDTIVNSLPINGKLNYDKISVHPFRDFPNISLKIHGLEVVDSLNKQHKLTPVKINDLYLNGSLTSLRKKELNIESIELVGLSINMLDQADGYSNLKSLIKKKAKQVAKKENKKDWTIAYNSTNLIIKDFQLNKIDKAKQQNAHLSINEVELKNNEVDSLYQLSLNLEKIVASHVPEKSAERLPLQLSQVMTELQVNKSFSEARIISVELKETKLTQRKKK